MSVLYVTLVVLVSDQAIKLLLRRFMGSDAVALAPFGCMQMVAGRLWLWRFRGRGSALEVWCFWGAAAAPLLIVSALFPWSAELVGLLLGGSLSHAVESSMRGSITDYICLPFWPAFNLADVALVVGTIGMIGELPIIMRAMVS